MGDLAGGRRKKKQGVLLRGWGRGVHERSFDGLWVNRNRRGTRGQLVGGTVEVQVDEKRVGGG